MTSNIDIPPPPRFEHSDFAVPDFVSWDHPNTKWILNTFRSAASSRLVAMNKERPEIFDQVFQIPDNPDKITWDSGDYEPMFKRSTVLYLRPLSLAIYMRRLGIAKLLVKNGLVDNTEVSYATDIKGNSNGDDSKELRELRPVTVAIRRNTLDILPVIFSTKARGLRACDPFNLRYVSVRVDKCSKFKDALDYAITVVRKNRILPVARIFDTLVFHCPGFCAANTAQSLCPNHGGPKCSLFQRLAKYLISEDGSNRLTLPLLQSFEQLMRHRDFYKAPITMRNPWFSQYSFATIETKWSGMPIRLQDCLVTLALMIRLHEVFQEKSKTSILIYATSLISRMAASVGCRSDLLMSRPEELQLSLKFLLEISLKNSPELYNMLEGGDNRTVARRPISPKVLDMLKPPSKPAIKYLQGNLKELTEFEKRKGRESYTDTTVTISIQGDSSDAEPHCKLCLLEAKEKSAHPADPLATNAYNSDGFTIETPLTVYAEFVQSSGPPTPSPIDRGVPLRTLDHYSLVESAKRTLEYMIPSPTVIVPDTTTSSDTINIRTTHPVLQESISSPKILEDLTFYETTQDLVISQTVETPKRHFPALYSTYQHGGETSKVSTKTTCSSAMPTEVREILQIDPAKSETTTINLEAVSATNRLRQFLDQSELEYVASTPDGKPTPLYPQSLLPCNRFKPMTIFSESDDDIFEPSSLGQPPGISLINDEYKGGPCNLHDVDQLIDQIASSAAATEDLMLSDVDSVLIDGMLQEYLNKTNCNSDEGHPRSIGRYPR